MKGYCKECCAHVDVVDVKEIPPEERDDLKEAVIEENKKLFQGTCPECGTMVNMYMTHGM